MRAQEGAMYKRFESRRMAAVPMEIITAKTDLPMEFVSFDLSPGGAYLMTDAVPRLGEQLVCAFDLDGESPMCFFGVVSRINQGRRACDRGPRGFGVRFLDARPMERLKIRRSIKALAPTIPAARRDNALTSAMGWS
jgi:Tfp pilus assembly protein PilZ